MLWPRIQKPAQPEDSHVKHLLEVSASFIDEFWPAMADAIQFVDQSSSDDVCVDIYAVTLVSMTLAELAYASVEHRQDIVSRVVPAYRAGMLDLFCRSQQVPATRRTAVTGYLTQEHRSQYGEIRRAILNMVIARDDQDEMVRRVGDGTGRLASICFPPAERMDRMLLADRWEEPFEVVVRHFAAIREGIARSHEDGPEPDAAPWALAPGWERLRLSQVKHGLDMAAETLALALFHLRRQLADDRLWTLRPAADFWGLAMRVPRFSTGYRGTGPDFPEPANQDGIPWSEEAEERAPEAYAVEPREVRIRVN